MKHESWGVHEFVIPWRLPVGQIAEFLVDFLRTNMPGLFSVIKVVVSSIVEMLDAALTTPAPWVLVVILAAIAWWVRGMAFAFFTAVGLLLIQSMDLWNEALETLALILTATAMAIIIGIPLGILAARYKRISLILRPVLDLMQTMPAFVYLIPAVIFFSLGEVPGVLATLIFSVPPAIRLTDLGIRQVPAEIVEAAIAFGSTPNQILSKVQIPIAMPTIMAGINQTIMLALSMVVIAGMIGAGGLGAVVLQGITSLDIALGFEGGLAIVLIAIFLDRLTESIGKKGTNKRLSPGVTK